MSDIDTNEKKLEVVPFYIIRDDDEHVIFHSADTTLKLKAAVAAQVVEFLLPLLNGSFTQKDICARLESSMTVQRCSALLDRLTQHGLVRRHQGRPATLDDHMAILLEPVRRHYSQGTDGEWDAVQALRGAHIAVVNLGAMSVELINDLASVGIGSVSLFGPRTVAASDVRQIDRLSSLDIGRPWEDVLLERLPFGKYRCEFALIDELPATAEQWTAALQGISMVAVALDTPTFFYDELFTLNAAAIATGTPWMILGSVQRFGLSVGPIFVPGATACFKCFELRLKSNLHDVAVPELLEKYARQGGDRVDFGSFGPKNNVAANLCALEICNYLIPGRTSRTVGRMLSLDLDGHELALHHVLRLPRCPACSIRSSQARVRAWG